MSETHRLGVVIGARWLALNSDQGYITEAAELLADALFDSFLGACEPAVDGIRVLHDPTHAQLDIYMRRAFAAASGSGSMLAICLVGHGYMSNSQGPFYFVPSDHPGDLGAAQGDGYPLTEHIRSLDAEYNGTDGLLLLVDACGSGNLWRPVKRDWALQLKMPRLAVGTSTGAGPAWGARFTRAVAGGMESGIPGAHFFIKPGDFEPLLDPSPEGTQKPHYFSNSDDAGLWVSANRATSAGFIAHLAWGRTGREWLYHITDRYQRLEIPNQVADATVAHRAVAILGPSGCGKTATLQMIAIDSLDMSQIGFFVKPGKPPQQAVAFFPVAADSTPTYFAEWVYRQLDECLRGGFREAESAFRRTVDDADVDRLSSTELLVTGPLRHLPKGTTVLLVVDALDQLSSLGADGILSCLTELADERLYGHVRLVVSARHRTGYPSPALPSGFVSVSMPDPTSNQIRRYLRRRGVDLARLAEVESVAAGNWLIITLLCNGLADRPGSDGGLPATREELYNGLLEEACTGADWKSRLAPVMAVMTCAGAGVALPLDVLCEASGELGGPSSMPPVRSSIVALHRVVERVDPGTGREHVMLIHPTLIEHLSNPPGGFALPSLALAHSAIATALARLAPMEGEAEPEADPARAYANRSEASHRWEAGDYAGAVDVLIHRALSNARENRERWLLWTDRIAERLGPAHRLTFQARQQLAFWTSRCGLYSDALDLYRTLVPELTSAFGDADPLVLRILLDESMCYGVNGHPAETRDRLRELEPRVARAMGPLDNFTLEVQHALGSWTGLAGDPHSAVANLRTVLDDCQAHLGPEHPETLACRNSLARWTGESGEPSKAVDEFRLLLPLQTRQLGPAHRETLRTRYSIAYWSGESGRPVETLALLRDLIEVQREALGDEHPDTLRTVHGIGLWTGVNGDPGEAVRVLTDLLPVRERVLGPDHPDTLRTLNNLGRWTGALGHTGEAIAILEDTLARRTRTLGAEHPDTMRTVNNIIDWTGAAGDHHRALELADNLLPLQQRVLGPNHQDTLRTRFNQAKWLAADGRRTDALDALRALHRDQVSALGPQHPDAMRTARELDELADPNPN
jgi:hypothetical protein